ncbi:MAG: endonuclease/exonuclease/phosphatase family protein [Myxococcota bacterium]
MPLALALASLQDAGAQTARNVHIATYNVQMLPFPASTDGKFHSDDGQPLTNVERAQELSRRIAAQDLEIVALQEVFDEDARKQFVLALAPTFPYYVSYIGNDWDLTDSGLMLFSRHPFAKLTLDDDHVYECGDVELGQAGSVSSCSDGLLGFTEFDCATGDTQSDCVASKGAGLVRVELPFDESLLVAFSHFRASYPGDPAIGEVVGAPELVPCAKAAERRDALERVAKLVGDATAEVEGDPLDANVVLLGDLNIDGNPHHQQGSTCLDAEWDDAFSWSSQVAFSGCASLDLPTCEAEGRVMVDAWAFTTSPDDLGRTSTFPFTTDLADRSLDWLGQRLDYVAVRGPVGPGLFDAMVPQHLTIAWALAGRTGNLSDHLPVGVDLLLPGDRTVANATPSDAARVTVPASGTAAVPLAITTPGQVQWTRVDAEPGTYTVRTGTSAVAADVYASTDLSRPIEPRRASDLDGGGFVYLLSSPPYYVRTFAVVPGFRDHDRSATPTYTVSVREHQCKSPLEPCILTAGETAAPLEVEWPAGTPVNPEDAMYFEFYADDPDAQGTPTFHEFEVGGDGTSPLPKLQFDALDLAGALPLPGAAWTDLALDPDRLVRRADKIRGNPSGKPSFANHLLRVTRDPGDLGWGGTVRVMHRTNLTYFTPLTISVLQEDDASAHDELWIYLEPSPAAPFHDAVTGDTVHGYVSQFVSLPPIDEVEDGGGAWPAAVLGSRRLTEELPLLMVEDDDEDGDPEQGDFLFAEPHPAAGLGTTSGRALAGLPLDRPRARATWVFTDDPTVADDDSAYRYQLVFDVSHTPPCFTTCD